ncbi:hypothetical protein L2E75_24220 [Planktothrix agardhii 1807]|uniref:hypothetical protein n=1 Tax=Planktothrix agardhii TaxID=1160 RepID=UPI001F370BE6|nr:hypothetical protein [Planktothrix agardhii]MCF3569214.1 hypothetical protein [Planktothrix agardhii 1807]
MKELEVYVISSALGKTGIHWRKVESSQSVLGYPDMLEKRLVKKKNGDLGTIEYRINYQKLSFVIMRHSQQLLFLVAGIEALEERSNQLGSTIYNAVAWVINEAINFKGLEEFEVNLNKINQLTENSADKLEQLLPNLDKAEGDQQIWYKKVEKTSNEQEIISLAEKIINTGLPEDDLAILISKGDENAVSVSPIDLDLKTKQSEVSKDQEDPDSALIEGNETEKPDQKSKEVSDEKKLIKLLLIFFLITSLLVLLLVVINRINKEKEEPNQISTPQTIISPQTNHSI